MPTITPVTEQPCRARARTGEDLVRIGAELRPVRTVAGMPGEVTIVAKAGSAADLTLPDLTLPDLTLPDLANEAPVLEEVKPAPYKRAKGAAVSVIRLPLDTSAAGVRDRIEKLYSAQFKLRKVLQADVQQLCAQFWAMTAERAEHGWFAVADELGLTRNGLQQLAWAHLDASVWMKDHTTKALVSHLANNVWEATSRHLYGDAKGKRNGALKVGRWFDFQTLYGRAKSRTQVNKWETLQVHGTLQDHLDTYRHPGLPVGVTVAQVLALPAGTPVLAQPRALPRPPLRLNKVGVAQVWDYAGPLAFVFHGGPSSTRPSLVVPIRLPGGAGQWPHLAHSLSDPELWTSVNLVRHRDVRQPGGWRYEVHLLIEKAGYASPATKRRRAAARTEDRKHPRMAGVDYNVSNISIVSLPEQLRAASASPAVLRRAIGGIRSTVITDNAAERDLLARSRARAARGLRRVERSRRALNPDQYLPSERQAERAAHRAARKLPPVQITLPTGARTETLRGGKPTPSRAYRKDTLSGNYRTLRGQAEMNGAALTAARKARAALRAQQIIAIHGIHYQTEEGSFIPWANRAGKSLHAFTPGMQRAALKQEVLATGGSFELLGTRLTAMSQHCLCGNRVPKPLSQRTHTCPECGLVCPRDLMSAALLAHGTVTAGEPKTGRRNEVTSARTLRVARSVRKAADLAAARTAAATPLSVLAGRTPTVPPAPHREQDPWESELCPLPTTRTSAATQDTRSTPRSRSRGRKNGASLIRMSVNASPTREAPSRAEQMENDTADLARRNRGAPLPVHPGD